MRPARILLQKPIQLEKSWCWRNDWITGFDSAYGLFSKFARLNAMNARELAELFINRDSDRRTSILRSPSVDLRSGELFDLLEIARLLRLDVDHIHHAFLLDRLNNSGRKSSKVLRWCPCCANNGFHSTVFQFELLSVCPAHGLPIHSRCVKCKAQIPYRLQMTVFNEPFCCPTCATDFAPALRNPKTRSLKLRQSETVWITNLVNLFLFEDKMVPVKSELNRQLISLGNGEVAFASADWHRIQSEYIGFVKQVLEDLNAEATGTQALPLEHISITTKGNQAKQSIDTDKRNKMRRTAPPDIEFLTVLKRGWDARLRASYLVYNSARRHLWRHVVHQHQGCITTAGKHFWWHMEGELTSSFCPIAEAFLRWRMYWEACSTPRYLLSDMRKDPFGIATWMAESAPFCPPGWTWEEEQWISDHVFGKVCFSSFRELLDISIQDRNRDRIEWNGHVLSGKHNAYWAIAGRDMSAYPLRIYEQSGIVYDLRATVDQCCSDKAHQVDHWIQIKSIKR